MFAALLGLFNIPNTVGIREWLQLVVRVELIDDHIKSHIQRSWLKGSTQVYVTRHHSDKVSTIDRSVATSSVTTVVSAQWQQQPITESSEAHNSQ